MKKVRLLSVLLPLAVLASFAGTGLSVNAEPSFYTYDEEATRYPAIRQLVAEAHFRAISEYRQIIEEAWIWNPANDRYYILTEPMPWTEAEAWAQERGGHLVTLRNWEEELWIKDKFGQDELFWIGFNDIEEEGNWVWSSGEPVVYTNWQIREPNNCDDWPTCGPEGAAVMNWGTNEKIDGQWFNYCGDYWNDLSIGQEYRGVAEILANFEEIPEYTLTVSSTVGGSVTTPGERTFTYDEAIVVNLIAEADEGYQFDNWIGDVETIANVKDATTIIIVDSNYAIAANFKAIPKHTLTISGTAGGSVTTPGEGDFIYEEGTVVGLEAKPEEGYQFVEWTGNVDTITNVEATSTTIKMNDDYSITASFEEAIGGCFIATAAYGTPMAEEIQILREFRDEYLLTNTIGQAFVDLYYKVSPPMAEFITKHPTLKPIVRAGLLPAVAMSNVAVNTTVVEKMAIVGVLALVSIALATRIKRRRGITDGSGST